MLNNEKYKLLIDSATELASCKEFDKEVNYRPFEEKVTKIASSYKINKELYDFLKQSIDIYYKSDEKLAFTIFFILFTICRRQNYGNILNLVKENENLFDEYMIMKHIYIMAVLSKSSHSSLVYKTLYFANKLVNSKSDKHDFTTHTGVLNAYCSLVCKYFEFAIDERKEERNVEMIKKALVYINRAIFLEKKEKGSEDLVYNKFYLNRGRIQILLGDYTKGENDIQRAIELVPMTADRESVVNEYSQYLVKASIIHAYDINEEKVEDLDKIKVGNYKSIALMTTLLGFLLGAINIFANINDTKTLAILMLAYCGLLLVLLGVILLGLGLMLKEKKKIFYVYDVIVLLIGIAIFASTFMLINRGW